MSDMSPGARLDARVKCEVAPGSSCKPDDLTVYESKQLPERPFDGGRIWRCVLSFSSTFGLFDTLAGVFIAIDVVIGRGVRGGRIG